MPLKLNISEKGKSWKLEVEPEVLSGKSIGDTFDGKLLKPELEGYELNHWWNRLRGIPNETGG